MTTDGLRSAMWYPIDSEAKARHLESIATALTMAPPVKRARTRATRPVAIVAASLVVVMVGGAALAAEGSLPGDLLYPLKQVTEGVRSWFDDTIVAEHRVDELNESIRRDLEPSTIDSRLQDAEAEVDRLETDHPLRDELADLRIQIAEEDGAPPRDAPPTTDEPRSTVPDRSTTTEATRSTTRASDRPATTLPASDRAPPQEGTSDTGSPSTQSPPRTDGPPVADTRPPAGDSVPPTTPPRDG